MPLKPIFKKIVEFFDKILNLVYPPRCPVCNEVLENNEILAHKQCIKKLPLIDGNVCAKCGKKLAEDEVEYCFDCKKNNFSFNQGRALYIRNDITRDMIYRFKYKDQRYIGKFIGEQFGIYFYDLLRYWQIEAIIPVPLHESRLRKRGFNQSIELAKSLQEYLYYHHKIFIPIYPNLIIRNKKTSRQKDLNVINRKENIFNAFSIGKVNRIPKSALIVDDIYTTGSTIENVSKVLKSIGVKEIYFVVATISS